MPNDDKNSPPAKRYKHYSEDSFSNEDSSSSEAESSSNESQGNDASKENSSKVSKPTPRLVFFHSGCRAESRKVFDDFSDRGPGPIC